MKHLFVIRHGDYKGKDLSDLGRDQIRRIADDMKVIVGNGYNGHYLLSSPVIRAEQTAEIIAQAFGLETFERNIQLFVNNGTAEELKAIDGMITPHNNNDIVTIITHQDVVGTYPRHIVRTLFGRNYDLRIPNKGEGVHLDLEAKRYQMLPFKGEGVHLDLEGKAYQMRPF
ncbi:histidine phosphatase family protein [Candidatus Woesearchaeota archaeon]|nr:histidine phosphatase family protein [Candidatus Woesearchaeota archaeon]